VTSSDGTVVGRIGAVRGEPAEDIFYGIVVRSESSPPRYLLAGSVAKIVSGRVELELSTEEFNVVPVEKRRLLAPRYSLRELMRRAGLR
jgi:hypothetical protein